MVVGIPMRARREGREGSDHTAVRVVQVDCREGLNLRGRGGSADLDMSSQSSIDYGSDVREISTGVQG